jgi:hypothetical protein
MDDRSHEPQQAAGALESTVTATLDPQSPVGYCSWPCARCSWPLGGLILDATVVEKPYTHQPSKAAWIWSSKRNKVVSSACRWCCGSGRRARPVFHPPSASGTREAVKVCIGLGAAELCRNRLRCKPQFVLFNSWYPAQAVLKWIRDYGQACQAGDRPI